MLHVLSASFPEVAKSVMKDKTPDDYEDEIPQDVHSCADYLTSHGAPRDLHFCNHSRTPWSVAVARELVPGRPWGVM